MKRKRLALLLAAAMTVTSLDTSAMFVSGADFSSEVEEEVATQAEEGADVAEDASANTKKKFSDSCKFYQVAYAEFGDKDTLGKAIGKEFAAFLGARLGTGLLDMLIMYLCVDLLGWNDMVMKLASNVIVVILNYILSKFFIFKKKEK